MQNLSYLLNRFIGPFFAGVLLAAFASVSDPISAVILLSLAGCFGLISLPKNAGLIERLFRGAA